MWARFGDVIEIEARVDLQSRTQKVVPNVAPTTLAGIPVWQNWERTLWWRKFEVLVIVIGIPTTVGKLIHRLQESAVQIEQLAPVFHVRHHYHLLLGCFVTFSWLVIVQWRSN
jgi:hypothetical protein